MRYPVFLQKDESSEFGVVVPDLPGCYSAGSTEEEAISNAEEAILTHIEGLLIDNDPVPRPSSIDEIRDSFDHENPVLWAMVSVDLAKLSDRSRRVNISLPERILSKIDSCAEKEGSTRSGFLVSAVLEYISRRGE